MPEQEVRKLLEQIEKEKHRKDFISDRDPGDENDFTKKPPTRKTENQNQWYINNMREII